MRFQHYSNKFEEHFAIHNTQILWVLLQKHIYRVYQKIAFCFGVDFKPCTFIVHFPIIESHNKYAFKSHSRIKYLKAFSRTMMIMLKSTFTQMPKNYNVTFWFFIFPYNFYVVWCSFWSTFEIAFTLIHHFIFMSQCTLCTLSQFE